MSHFEKSHIPEKLTTRYLLTEAAKKTQGLKLKFWLFAFVIFAMVLVLGFVLLLFQGFITTRADITQTYLSYLLMEAILLPAIIPVIAGLFGISITAIAGLSIEHITLSRYFNRLLWAQLIKYRVLAQIIREVNCLVGASFYLVFTSGFDFSAALQLSIDQWHIRVLIEMIFALTIPYIVHNKVPIITAMSYAIQSVIRFGLPLFYGQALLILLCWIIAVFIPEPYCFALLGLILLWLMPMLILMYAIVYKKAQDSILTLNP